MSEGSARCSKKLSPIWHMVAAIRGVVHKAITLNKKLVSLFSEEIMKFIL